MRACVRVRPDSVETGEEEEEGRMPLRRRSFLAVEGIARACVHTCACVCVYVYFVVPVALCWDRAGSRQGKSV